MVREGGDLRPHGDREGALLTRGRTGAEPIASRAALAGAAVELVRGVFPLEKKVRLLGVAVSGFGAAGECEDGPQIAFDFGRPG